MRRNNTIKAMITLSLILTMTACDKEDNKVIVKEPGQTLTIIDNFAEEESKPDILVEKINHYEEVIISDWLNEDTVIVSKSNDTLDKMSLAELSEHYPKSLYSLDITTKEYQLLKEQKNVFLDGAFLSMDKKYLLYYEATLGDPVYYVMNMDTLEGFGLMGEPIGGAINAKWADNDTIIGPAYSGGAYLADRAGNISLIDELKDESLYLLAKIGDNIYFNTQSVENLMKLNLTTKEKEKIEDLDRVINLIPSPDGKQMLIVQLQPDGTKVTMLVYNLETGEKVNIVEGVEMNGISGISWSPDQRRIAYNLKEDVNNASKRSLYVYDMLTGESIQLAVDVYNLTTSWSPSGNKLACTEFGTRVNSSIIYLEYNE